MKMNPIHIIGGGLAGCEAAWQIAARGVHAILHEMRPLRVTAAHKTESLAELVCSNSFRSDDHEHNAVGLLHEEMRRLNSLIMRAAGANQVPPKQEWVFEIISGLAKVRLVLPIAQVSDLDDVVYKDDDISARGITLTLFPDSSGNYIYEYSNDGIHT